MDTFVSSDISYGNGAEFGEYPVSTSKNGNQSKFTSSFDAIPSTTQNFSVTDTFQDYSTTGNGVQYDILSGGDSIDTNAFPGTTTTYETSDYQINDLNIGRLDNQYGNTNKDFQDTFGVTTYGGAQSTTDNYGFDSSVDIFGSTSGVDNAAFQFNTTGTENYDFFSNNYETTEYNSNPQIIDTFQTVSKSNVDNTTYTTSTPNYETSNFYFNDNTTNNEIYNTGFNTSTNYDTIEPFLNTTTTYSKSTPVFDTTYDITSDLIGTNTYETSSPAVDTGLNYYDLFNSDNYGSGATFSEYQTTTNVKKPASTIQQKSTFYTTSPPVDSTSYDLGLDLGFLDSPSTYDTTNVYSDFQTSTNLNGLDTFSSIDKALYSTPLTPQYTSSYTEVTAPSVYKSSNTYTYTPPAPISSTTLDTGATFTEYAASPSKPTSMNSYVLSEPVKPITVKIPKVHQVVIPKIKRVYIPSNKKIIVEKPSTSIVIPKTSKYYSYAQPAPQTITTVTSLNEPKPSPSITMASAPLITSTIIKPKRSISNSYISSKAYKYAMPADSISMVPFSQVPYPVLVYGKKKSSFFAPSAHNPLKSKIIKNIKYPQRAYSAKL